MVRRKERRVLASCGDCEKVFYSADELLAHVDSQEHRSVARRIMLRMYDPLLLGEYDMADASEAKTAKPVTIQISPTMRLPMSAIVVDYDFNQRQRRIMEMEGKRVEEYRGIPELARDIKDNGQITPVLVQPVPGKEGQYFLVAGFRRYNALKLLGADFIEAKIDVGDARRGALLNLKENINRDSLTSYEIAHGMVWLRDTYGYTQAQVAKELAAGTDYKGDGMSRSYVGNLMRCIDNLHDDIAEAWKNNAPGLTTDLLIKWAGREKDEQVELWDELKGVVGEGGEEGGGEGEESDKPKAPKKLSMSGLLAAIQAVEDDPDLEKKQAVKDAMLAALHFATGKLKTLRVGGRVVYDPKIKRVKRGEPEIQE